MRVNMNKNRNLYKLDDFFIIISYLLILPLLYIFKPILSYIINNGENTQEILIQFVQSRTVIISILLGSIIFLQILGRLIRKEEKILVKILDIVVMYKTISINQLQHTLDMNQNQTEKYIKKLSNIGRLNINFDGTYVKLQLNQGTDTKTHDSFNKESTSNYDFPPPIPESSSNIYQEETEKRPSTLEVSTEQAISSKEDLQNLLGNLNGKQITGKKFNVVLFIVLFFAFWPIAFIYAASYYMKSQKGKVIEERLKNRLKNM
jgi:hypothetical protein